MSSTGSAGADLLVGWGCVENSAIVSRMDCAKVGFVVWRRGGVEVSLHDVRIENTGFRWVVKASEGCADGFKCVAWER